MKVGEKQLYIKYSTSSNYCNTATERNNITEIIGKTSKKQKIIKRAAIIQGVIIIYFWGV